MKRSFALALVLCMTLCASGAMAVGAITHSANADNTLTQSFRNVTDYQTIDNTTTTWGEPGTETWYLSSNANLFILERVTVLGDVHVVLEDGSKLTTAQGIRVSGGNSLYIHGQSSGTGELVAVVSQEHMANAAIGGNGAGVDLSSGDVLIHGGKVTATGYAGDNGSAGAGIGGGAGSAGGKVTIYGGTVEATGGTAGYSGAGIGGGGYHDGSAGDVTIYGGMVHAVGGSYAAGIGGGYSSACGPVTIHGGMVTAIGGKVAAGIGGGSMGNGGTVTITGGTVEVAGGGNSAAIGIGGILGNSPGTLTVTPKEGRTIDVTVGSSASDTSAIAYEPGKQIEPHNWAYFCSLENEGPLDLAVPVSPAGLPSTGDSTPVLLLAVLMLLSLSGLMMIRRKRSA